MPSQPSVSAHRQIHLVTSLPGQLANSSSPNQLCSLDPLTTTIEASVPTTAGPVLFALGQVDVTPAAIALFERIARDPRLFLAVHVTGTWGHIDPHRTALNQAAIDDGYGTVRSLFDLANLFKLSATIEIMTKLQPESTTTLVLTHGQGAEDAGL